MRTTPPSRCARHLPLHRGGLELPHRRGLSVQRQLKRQNLLVQRQSEVLFGLLRLGALLKYIPQPLIIGFTSGIALVIFTTWKPLNAIWGSYLFGTLYWLYQFLPTLLGFSVPGYVTDLIQMVPYVVTIIVLVATSMRKKREDQPPAGLGLPYFREER